MEDKTFDLVEKLYIEMQNGFEKVYSEMHNGFKELNDKLDRKADKTDIVLLEKKLDDYKAISVEKAQVQDQVIAEMKEDIESIKIKIS